MGIFTLHVLRRRKISRQVRLISRQTAKSPIVRLQCALTPGRGVGTADKGRVLKSTGFAVINPGLLQSASPLDEKHLYIRQKAYDHRHDHDREFLDITAQATVPIRNICSK